MGKNRFKESVKAEDLPDRDCAKCDEPVSKYDTVGDYCPDCTREIREGFLARARALTIFNADERRKLFEFILRAEAWTVERVKKVEEAVKAQEDAPVVKLTLPESKNKPTDDKPYPLRRWPRADKPQVAKVPSAETSHPKDVPTSKEAIPEICDYCLDDYIPERANQATCGKPECAMAHRRLIKKRGNDAYRAKYRHLKPPSKRRQNFDVVRVKFRTADGRVFEAKGELKLVLSYREGDLNEVNP
ncbi:MAG: hypothetical protein WC891_02900 [Actinomycetota bacterium]